VYNVHHDRQIAGRAELNGPLYSVQLNYDPCIAEPPGRGNQSGLFATNSELVGGPFSKAASSGMAANFDERTSVAEKQAGRDAVCTVLFHNIPKEGGC
jgi:hypothetical protein